MLDYIRDNAADELTVLVSSGHSLIDRMRLPRATVHLAHAIPPVEHPDTVGPAACLYVIGRNAFFEYRDLTHKIGWEIIEGANVLSRPFGKHVAHYVGLHWQGWDDGREKRTLIIVVPALDEMSADEIRKMLRYYGEVLDYPQDFAVEVYRSFRQIGATRRVPLPSFEALAGGPRDVADKSGRRVFYYRDSWNLSTRKLNIYDGSKP